MKTFEQYFQEAMVVSQYFTEWFLRMFFFFTFQKQLQSNAQHIPSCRVWLELIHLTDSLGRVGLLKTNKFRKLVSRFIIPTAFRKGLELNRGRRGECIHHLEIVTRDLVKDRCHSKC